MDSTAHDVVYAEHLHDALEILWVRSGCSEVSCHGRRCPMHGGDAVIFAPNEVHAGGACNHSRFSFATLHVPSCLLPMLSGDFDPEVGGHWRPPPMQLLGRRLAEQLYQRLIRGLPATVSAGDQLACLRDALGPVFQRSARQAHRLAIAEPHPAVERVRSIINRSFADPLDIATLALEVGLHEHYLISLFREHVGIPPHQYQIAQRVDYGRRLLDSEMPLGAVACTAGFADQSHFNRLFKRTYRMTPGAFRERIIPF